MSRAATTTGSPPARTGRGLLLPATLALCLGCPSAVTERVSTEVATQFLYFKKAGRRTQGGDGAVGGVGDLFVEVGPNPGDRAPVRFAETVSGGVGDAWRATVWMALLAASSALDVDPLSFRVTVEAEGSVDGPSAGALMTAAVMAGIRRDPALPGATITGAVNPDLTIGPVGGVPEKVAAALDAGKTRIGIPVGQGRSASMLTGRPVDVVALARDRGAQVFVLRDMGDAYEVLTGHRLPAAAEASRERMELPNWVKEVFAREAGNAVTEIEEQHAQLSELIDGVPYEGVRSWRSFLLEQSKEVRRMAEAGDAVTAMYRAAELQGSHYRLTTGLLSRLGADLGKWQYVRMLLRTLRHTVGAMLEEAVPRWKAAAARDAVDVPFVVDTFEAFIHAMRSFAQVGGILTKSPELRRLLEEDGRIPSAGKEAERLAVGVGELTSAMIEARTNLLLGRAYLAVGQERRRRATAAAGGQSTEGKTIGEEVIARVSAQYERVADANLQYANSLLLHEPPGGGAPRGRQLQRLMELDEDYRQAVMNRRLPTLLDETVLDDRQQLYAKLSGAVSSYFGSATVISKRYSLNAVFSPDRRTLVGVRHQAAFESMLSLADRQARQVAARCLVELGEVPLTTLIEYELSSRLEKEGRKILAGDARHRDEGVRLRLAALGHAWRAWTMGRLALATHRMLLEEARKR